MDEPKPKKTAGKRPAAARQAASPAAKRAKPAAGSKASGSNRKQTTLQSKGFSALSLRSSQPAAGAGAEASASQQPSQQDAAARQTVSPGSPAAAAPAAAAAAAGLAEQWVDKHAPATPADLVVHKRKVAEVQQWLQAYLDHRQHNHTCVLLVTGPSGCGKSATLRVLADAMNFELLEWSAPVPTLWADYKYQAGAGVGYSSKLDDFDVFVARCKFAALPLLTSKQPGAAAAGGSSQQAGSQQPSQSQALQQQQQHSQATQQPAAPGGPKLKLLVMDDLPHVVDATRRQRLAASLQDLALTARCPVVVVVTTEDGGSGSKGAGGYGSYGDAAGITTKGLHRDLLAVLDQVGASTINFNPVTNNVISKTLSAIAEREGHLLDVATADDIAASAAGDLRNAIYNLQLLLQKPGAAAVPLPPGSKRGKAKAPRRPRKAAGQAAAAPAGPRDPMLAQVARDQHLSVFHAVGKILHYKRQPAPAAAASQEGDEGGDDGRPPQLLPLDIDPEGVVQASGLEALQVTAFLSENYPHFIADDAMQQAAAAAAYLSDAALLASGRSSNAPLSSSADGDGPSSIGQQAASSVAARGLLASNTRPAPSRWLPLKGPSCFVPERAAAANLSRLSLSASQLQTDFEPAGPVTQQAVLALAGQLLHSGRQERAAQALPYLQLLGRQPSYLWLHCLLPASWAHVWGGALTERQSVVVQRQGGGLRSAVLAAAARAAGGLDAPPPTAAAAGAAAVGTGQQQQQQEGNHQGFEQGAEEDAISDSE